MSKRKVSKKIYLAISLLFYSFCSGGLLWQVTQISEIFFEFDTIKDINVFSPEEMNQDQTVFYLCLHSDAILNTSLHHSPISRISDISIGTRFNITISTGKLFNLTGESPKKILGQILRYPHHCYIVDPFGNIEFNKRFRGFGSAIGYKNYPFDIARIIGNPMMKKRYAINSNSYHMIKLKSPYKDACLEYRYISKRDRNDAIADCNSNQTHISVEKVMNRSEYSDTNMNE